MSAKRPRSISSASSSSSSPAASGSSSRRSLSPPASKLSRLPPSSSSSSPSFTCSLPPTCSSHPVSFSTAQQAEAHYGKMHALVCDAEVGVGRAGGAVAEGEKGKGKAHRRCGAIFPEKRLMDLHQNELHNPLLAEREARGERIYECYLPTTVCSKKFRNVKGRRLHLVAAHGFPSSYFFAVVKEGIGPLLRAQGPAASLLRPEYDPASPQAQAQRARSLSTSPTKFISRLPPLPHQNLSSSSSPPPHQLDASLPPPPPPSNRQPPPHLPQDATTTPKREEVQDDPMMDSLTSSLASASLAFVPRAVGAKIKGKGKK
ncbi:hypothetical protein BDY24DRAFT_443414 [Mrakia frigida]|uniref:uncharacterized protein n=1 Tax=Mrakia frigida TaxID=29902 RepID=UPI003FCC0966